MMIDSKALLRLDPRLGAKRLLDLHANDFRLSLATGTPFPTTDQAAKSTIYLTPMSRGNRVKLYEGGTRGWQLRAGAEASVAVPSTQFRGFDIFAYWNAGSLAIETANWDQTTGAITAATAAAPSVVTSAGHGLANGDLVGLAGLNNTVGTDATQGLNNSVWRVANAAANTFEVEGSDTSGLAASTTGTWYKIPNTRTALGTQDGASAKASDATRLYVGSGMTTGTSGQCETSFGSVDSPPLWLLWNHYNRKKIRLRYTQSVDSYAYTTAVYRPTNGRGKLARIGLFVGLNEDQIEAESMAVASHSGGLFTYQGIDLDGAASNDAWLFQGGNNLNVRAELSRYAGIGFHYLTWLEKSDATGTTTWYGDAGVPTDLQSGFSAKLRC